VAAVRALLDTNILIDYLIGTGEARADLDRYEARLISPITSMEVMVGAKPEEGPVVRAFLATFELVPVNADVAERAVEIRRGCRIRLPDASARVANALLVTRNDRDFSADAPGVRIPYRV